MAEPRTSRDCADEEGWKARYLGARDAQERLEDAAGQRIGELAGLLAGIGRALSHERGLASRVEALTDALKRRPLHPDLGQEVRAVQDSLIRLSDAGARERGALQSALQRALAQLEPLARDRALRRRVDKVRTVVHRGGGASRASELVEALAALQGDLLPATGAAPGPAAPRARAVRVQAHGPLDGPVPTPPMTAAAVQAAPGTAGDEVASWPAVRAELLAMLDRVDPAPPLRSRLEQVRAGIEGDLDAAGLQSALEQVRELFDVTLSVVQGRFRDFLDTVDQRLHLQRKALHVVAEEGGSLDTLERVLGEMQAVSSEARGRLEDHLPPVMTDALTGLPNRRALGRHLAEVLPRALREGRPLTIAVAHLDHFGRIANEMGGEAAARALAVFVDLVRRRAGAGHFLGRYRGEDFVLLLPDTDAEAALRRADELGRVVASSGFSCDGVHVPMTAYFGVAQAVPGDDASSLLARADEALRAARSAAHGPVQMR
jgi:diguanylate cyclase (GGDEF)-like protein